MEGEAIFCYDKGWACSNEAAYVVERDIVNRDGQMFSKHTATVRVMDFFVTGEPFGVGDKVDIIFRNEEGVRTGYSGEVKGLTDAMAVLVISGEINFKIVLDTIKKQNHGK